MEYARNLACSVLAMASICVGSLARSKISRAWAAGRSDLVGMLDPHSSDRNSNFPGQTGRVCLVYGMMRSIDSCR